MVTTISFERCPRNLVTDTSLDEGAFKNFVTEMSSGCCLRNLVTEISLSLRNLVIEISFS